MSLPLVRLSFMELLRGFVAVGRRMEAIWPISARAQGLPSGSTKSHTPNIRAHQFNIHAVDGPSGLLIDRRNRFAFLGNQTIDFGRK